MSKAPKKTSEEPESQVFSQYDALTNLVGNFDSAMDKIALENDLAFQSMDTAQRLKGALPTGLLSVDLATNGGFGGGRMSYIFGPTGAGKSTIMYHSIHSAINRETRTCLFDHEACADPKYLENIGIDLAAVSGIRGKERWKKSPLYRYTEANVAESTFLAIFAILQALPYKIEMYDEYEKKHRYFLVDPTFQFRRAWSSINDGLKQDKVIETEDFAPQMLFVIDSVKGMNPEARNENPSNQALAVLARCLAANFPLIKGQLAKKHCCLGMTNHVTTNPGQKYGSPETEPGGSAVKFYPDLKLRAEANQYLSNMIEEPTIGGDSLDRYRPGVIKIVKNKGGSSFQSVEYRIWQDSNGVPGMGIDPVFDTYQFLEMTEQLGFTGKGTNGQDGKAEFKILIPGYDSTPLKWPDFKKLVLTDDNLHDVCAKQIADDYAQKRYYDWLAKKTADTPKKAKKDKYNKSAPEEPKFEQEDDDFKPSDSDTEVTV